MSSQEKPTPRMNGSELERALFRIGALREALNEIKTCSDVVPMKAVRPVATNALLVDDERARI